MVQHVCDCCKKVSDENKFVICCLCKNKYFHTCMDLTAAEVKSIKNKSSIKFTCSNCEKNGDDMNGLRSIIIALQTEIEKLKAVIKNPAPVTHATVDYENIIQEITERESRKRNLVIYGIPENNNSNQAEEKEKVKELICYLSPDIDTNNIDPRRLGKPIATNNRPRPIKITFNNENPVHTCISKASKLKNSTAYTNITISYDRTPKQVEYYKKIKSELQERVSSGEIGLKIKYIKGIPKIISEN